jgi:soluble lytic murein transglycosylase-like protein
MSTIRYRYAGAADVLLLARLNVQLVEEGADFGTTDLGWLQRRMRRWLGDGHNRAVLFEDERGRLLAYALYKEDAAEIYLRQFLVLRAARRRGVGREAFALLRSRIWSADKRLTLEVLAANGSAYRFWRSLGYRDCAVTLEIPAPARAPAASPQLAPAAIAAPLLLTRLLAVCLLLGHGPLRLLRRLAGDARQALARATGVLAFAGFISTPVAAASSLVAGAPLQALPPALSPVAEPDAEAAPRAITTAELSAMRASGGHCSAAVYRSAWQAARRYQLEPAVVLAVIEAESSCRSDAVSSAGALGLMQLVPDSGARNAYRLVYGSDRSPSRALLRDPEVNIRLGVAYLRSLRNHFAGIGSDEVRLVLAIASYNCGTDLFDRGLPAASSDWDPGEALRWIVQHAPAETRGYIRRVAERAWRYSSALAAARDEGAVLALAQ